MLEEKALEDYQSNLKLTAERQIQQAVLEKDRLIEEAQEQRKEADLIRDNQYTEIQGQMQLVLQRMEKCEDIVTNAIKN